MVQVAAAVLFGTCLAVIVGFGFDEGESAQVTAAIERDVAERKADMPPADRIYPFAHPLRYDATVTMGAERTRFYARSAR
jgi:hypothetical protein